MSLDVSLIVSGAKNKSGGIFIRENGQTKKISRQAWDNLYPNREPVEVLEGETDEVYSGNITHNLTEMASVVNLYEILWRPEELGFTKAVHLIDPLWKGMQRLYDQAEECKRYNPENGWGNYEILVNFVAEYLAACINYPDADVNVSR